MKAAPCRAP